MTLLTASRPVPTLDMLCRRSDARVAELAAAYERIDELTAALVEINSQAVCACIATERECFDMLENCAQISDAVLTPQVLT